MDSLNFVLKWCIYAMSVLTMLLSVAVLTLDLEHGGVNLATDLLLFSGMFGSAGSVVFHYLHPRLVYIFLMVLLSVVSFFARMYIRWDGFQGGLVSFMMVNALLGSVFIGLTYYTNADKDKSIVGLMLQSKSDDADGGDSKTATSTGKSETSSIVDTVKKDIEQSVTESTTGTTSESKDTSASTKPL